MLWQCASPYHIRDFAHQPSLSSKAYMDQALAQAKVKVSATSPTWEPQRSYERRLTNIMSKTKGLPHKPLTLYIFDRTLRCRIQTPWQAGQAKGIGHKRRRIGRAVGRRSSTTTTGPCPPTSTTSPRVPYKEQKQKRGSGRTVPRLRGRQIGGGGGGAWQEALGVVGAHKPAT